ncbi:hypothetical protein OH77DRAFT_319053 [Trametes cingulata]|nr:hypothetical protein OH77DRAFT_319053 [Trametes cingulata]
MVTSVDEVRAPDGHWLWPAMAHAYTYLYLRHLPAGSVVTYGRPLVDSWSLIVAHTRSTLFKNIPAVYTCFAYIYGLFAIRATSVRAHSLTGACHLRVAATRDPRSAAGNLSGYLPQLPTLPPATVQRRPRAAKCEVLLRWHVRLHVAWTQSRSMAVAAATIVSLQRRPWSAAAHAQARARDKAPSSPLS